MTTIGHTLTGLTIGYVAIPRQMPCNQRIVLLAVCAALASAPDLPFPYWGHDRYEISHSLLMTGIGVACLTAILLWRFRGRSPVGPRMLLGFALCWFSHLLLDSLYNDGHGIQIYWPWNNSSLVLPIPWLSHADRDHVLSMHNVNVVLLEVATFGPLLAVAYGIRRLTVSEDPSAE